MFALINVSLSSLCRSLSLGLLFVLTTLPLFAAQAKVTVTWPQPSTITYGTSISTPATATAGGVVVPGTFVYTPPLGTIPNAGTTRATAIFTPAAGGAHITTRKNIKVNQVTLTVTSRANKIYQAALPVLVPEYSGFVHGDTQATVLTGVPQLSTTATVSSPVGNYPITVKKGSLKSNTNYKLTYVTGTLKVTPATATIIVNELNHVYDGNGHNVIVSTTPPNLMTSVLYDGTSLLPIEAGTYPVVVTIINNANYVGSTNQSMVIAKASAPIILGDLAHTYDRNAHAASVSTIPASLPYSVTYNNSAVLPINAGTYAVTATINAPNHQGSASGLLIITQATQTITFAPLHEVTLGDLDQPVTATSSSGLLVSFAVSGPAEIQNGFLHITAGGIVTVTASQIGDTNYLSATSVKQTITVSKPLIAVADIGYAIAEGEAVTLIGTVSNVGSATMSYVWSQVSGPAIASFALSNQTTTTARFPLAGTYEVALSAINGHLTISDSTIVTVVASDVSHDLVAHYKFDEVDGDKALDASGKQHTGKLYGATRAAGKSQGALRFTGTSYVYVQGNEDLDLPTQALTLAVWLKPDRSLVEMTHPYPMPIYRADYATSVGYGLMVTVSETDQFGLRLHHRVGSGQSIEIATPQSLVANAWVHVAGVYDGTTMTLYRNGAAVATRTTGTMTVRNAGEVAMFLGRGFEGLMDDVRIYHRALSRTDVVGLAQGGLGRREPGANAGVDQVVTLLAPTTTLAGSASDDAGSGTTLIPTWTQISGPAPATISDSHTLNPNVTFNVTGSYRFQLSVSDGVLSGRDDMRIEVTDGAVDLATGLVLHYRCDEGSGTLVADTSGFAQNATFYGLPQWSDNGQFLGAVNLNGTSQIIAPSPAQISNLTRMTLSVWMRGNRPIVDMVHSWPSALYHADYATNRGFALMTTATDTNTFGFRLHTGTGRREVTMDGVPSGVWVHVVATYDGQVMRLFRDGVLVEINATGSIPLPAFDARLQIGIGYEGMFDDVRIYNRALSPTEVQSLHIVPPIGASG